MVPFRSYLAGPGGVRWFGLILWACLWSLGEAAELDPHARAWLERQPELATWSADVKQTRRLRSLTQPLINQGKVWFSAPNNFRWQIGDPPATVAIRNREELIVLYPRLRRAERYALNAANPLQDSLALLDAGFPRDEKDLLKRFNVLQQSKQNGLFELVLEPKTASARRLLPKMRIFFSTEDFTLRSTELEFTDGSTMRSDFSGIQINPKLEDSLFSVTIPEGFQTTEPTTSSKELIRKCSTRTSSTFARKRCLLVWKPLPSDSGTPTDRTGKELALARS